MAGAEVYLRLYELPLPLVAAALIYFLLLWPLVRMISRMQKPFVIPR